MKVLKKEKQQIYSKWFTLVELIVAVIISSIVLTILMSFITTSMNEISYSNRQTEVLENINNFSTTMNNYKWSFEDIMIVIDNTGTWSDTILMTNEAKNEWILVGIVWKESLSLENSEILFNTIYEKHLAIRELNTLDISNIIASPESVFWLNFNKDKLFADLVMKDFQVVLYNTWAIIDTDLEVLINYKEGVDWESWQNITNDWVYSINMIF